jgi:GH43 family beta-xylosidase
MTGVSFSLSLKFVRAVAQTALLAGMILTGYAAPAENFYNVIAQDGADPSIVHHTDGWYYYTKTTGGNVRLWRSRTLTGLDGSQSKVIWTPTAATPYSSNIWAPEIVRLDGKWYVYFAADDGDNENHRMYVLENTNADPFVGDWTFRGQITDATDRWAIDGTAFAVGTKKYFIWSGWPAGTNGKQNLYIAEMSNPWTISSARAQISTPTYGWETNASPTVNEGPEVIIRNGKINLVYSASGSWTDNYCLGLITADVGSNLLNAASWTKRSTPIFSTANSIWGPGHHTFTTSPDGREDWIVYHNARWQGAGWTRQIRAQKFTWNADDTPNLGTPVARHAAIPLPSGETGRLRYEAEDAVVRGVAQVVSGANSSGGAHVGSIDTVESGVTFTVSVPSSGTYMLAARTGCGMDDVTSATHLVSVNNGSSISLRTVESGWGNWGTAYARISLNAGTNTIAFSKGDSFAELDAIDLFLVQPTGSITASPEGLTAEPGDRFVRLSWAGDSVLTYTIRRQSAGGAWQTLATGLTMPSFVDQTAANGISYSYSITATSLMGFVSPASAAVTATPSASLTAPRLVALYKAENGARDSSGRGFHGIASGGVGVSTGRVDVRAAAFNGTAACFDIPNTLGPSFTISFWIRTTANGGSGTTWYEGLGLIDGEVNGTANDFGIALLGTGIGFGLGNPDATLRSTAAVNDGNWHQVTATRNGTSGQMRLYVDGALQGLLNGPTAPRSAAATLRVGSLLAQSNYFKGDLDEIRFYDGVLPGDAIAALASPAPRIVAQYDFEGNVLDATPYRHEAEPVGTPTFAAGRDGGQAVQFDGNSGLTIPASVAGDFSLSCWVKTTASGDGPQWYRGLGILDGEVNGVSSDFGLALVGSKAAFGVGNPDATLTSSASINDGNWHHLVVTRQNTSGEARIYIDGRLDSTQTMATGSRFAPDSLRIGMLAVGGNGFVGTIDDARIYNYPITATQAAALAARPPSVSTIADQTIPENTATGPLTATLSDPDTLPTSLVLTAQSSNTSLIPTGGIALTGSGAERALKITPTANHAGSATITLTVSDGSSSAQSTFLLTVTTTPAGWWRQTWFGSTSDEGDARATADPDSDGITNAWERLSGGSPLAADITAKPVVSLDGEYLQIDYFRSRAATDLQPQVEWSRDLQTWSADGVQDVILSTEGDIEKRRGRIPLGNAPAGFLRLRLNE